MAGNCISIHVVLFGSERNTSGCHRHLYWARRIIPKDDFVGEIGNLKRCTYKSEVPVNVSSSTFVLF